MPPSKQSGDLLDETEALITQLVQRAKRRRRIKVPGKDGGPETTNVIEPDIIDQVRAAKMAIDFLAAKAKLRPEAEESDFERNIKDLHGEGEGGSAAAKE